MDSCGNRIKQLTGEQQLPLRMVAAYLNISQAGLSRIEHVHRKITREQVVLLAQYFNTDENELLAIWLSDKLAYEVQDEDLAKQALKNNGEKNSLLKEEKMNGESLNILHNRLEKLKAGYSLTDRVEKKENFYSINNNELIIAIESINQSGIEKIIALKPQKVITLDILFKDNDQLKTNTVLQMRDAGADFKTI